ncbi:hypothetical protein PMAYCL1PPCAC_30566, partial [Pristionchus mayeri]
STSGMRNLYVFVVLILHLSVVISHENHDHLFGEAADVTDESHIREHMENKIDMPAHMDESQSRFLYFEMNDLNDDKAIDGIEIMKMMAHSHEQGVRAQGNPIADEEAMIKRVDRTLDEMDYNGDGLITFPEFCRHQEAQKQHLKNSWKDEA